MLKTWQKVCGITLFSTTILSGSLASATDPGSSLDKITVVATKSEKQSFDVPGMTSVIDTEDASIAGASNIKDLLQDVPGLEFGGSGRRNGQDITLRGYSGNGIIFLLDGARQKFEAAHDGKFFVDPELLKSVEVVKGPSSALYGSGGLGGVVSLTTKEAKDLLAPGENKGAKVSTGYQSVNDEWLASISGYGRTEKLDLITNILTRNSDDVELGNGTTLESDDKILSGMFKLGWSLADNHTLKFNIQGYNNDAREPNNPQVNSLDDTSESLVEKNVSSNTTKIQYEYDSPDNNLIKLKAAAYYTDMEVEEDILVATSTNAVGDTISRQLDTTGFTLENQSSFAKDSNISNTLTYGGEYYIEEQDGADSANGEVGGIPDAESEFGGIYLQDEISIKTEKIGEFLAIPGIRYDKYESNNDSGTSLSERQWSPKFALSYKPKDWLMLFGNYARAFRAPNMTEIFTTGTHFTIPGLGSNNFVANPDLKPETNESVEVGFGLQFENILKESDQIKFKASRFEIDSKDFIDTEVDFTFAPCCGTTTSVNVGQASLWGNEIEAGYENNQMLFNLGYSYLTGKNDETGEYLTNITPPTLTTNLGFKLPDHSSVVGVTSTFAGQHDNVNDTASKRDSYNVHNLYYEWQPKNELVVNLGIDNMFDKNYTRVFAGSAETGRNYKIKIGYKW